MFLKKIAIENFRGIKSLTLELNKGLNILIGENNSGKTAVMDALRLCFSYGNQRRDIYISTSDFHIDKTDLDANLKDIEFHLFFEIENPEEAGIFIDLVSINEKQQELQLHFRYYLDKKKGVEKVRYKVWGGDNEGQTITPEVLDLFYFVYLGALRNAVQKLRPIRGNKLGELYSNIETDETKQEKLSSKVHNVLSEDDDWTTLIEDGKEKVNDHLKETSLVGKQQNVEIDFLPFEFRKILDNLRIQIPVYNDDIIINKSKQKYFEISQNGLGYNNLIYTATVLGDLNRKRELDNETYIALLIEEPEAHLHPQLQDIFFNYLSKLNRIGFQIFISSHSPTITAKADLDSLIVLQNQGDKIYSWSIKNSMLNDDNKKYLQKFLDVTKSQLFFANGVILVEGISEALLMPIFSKMVGEEYDIEGNGIEIVNINGVAFEHFGKLFNADEGAKGLNCRCAILTDDDRNNQEEISSRAKNAKDLESGLLRVELAEKTFEYELFMSGNNKDILLNIFREMHPIAEKNIEKGQTEKEYAVNFVEKVGSNKAKSKLAHILAIKLEDDTELRENFTIPPYIERAIKWVVKGYLFSIDMLRVIKIEENLNNGVISEEFKNAFGSKELPLSETATIVNEKADKWKLTDGEAIYIVEKEKGMLNIYVKGK